jgi:hypothetical protein
MTPKATRAPNPRGVDAVRGDIVRRIATNEFLPAFSSTEAAAIASDLSPKEIALLSRPKAEITALASAWSGVLYAMPSDPSMDLETRTEATAAENGVYSDAAAREWIAHRRHYIRACMGVRGILPAPIHVRVKVVRFGLYRANVDVIRLRPEPDWKNHATAMSTAAVGMFLAIASVDHDWDCYNELLRLAVFQDASSVALPEGFLEVDL